MPYNLVYFLAFLPSISFAANLCATGEINYFSCSIEGGDKLISLCGTAYRAQSDNYLSIKSDAWLQYRFGKTGKIELTYPKSKMNIAEAFSGDFTLANGSRRYYELSFTIGKFRYGIERVSADNYANRVRVKSAKRSLDLRCNGEPQIDNVAGINGFESLVEALSRQ